MKVLAFASVEAFLEEMREQYNDEGKVVRIFAHTEHRGEGRQGFGRVTSTISLTAWRRDEILAAVVYVGEFQTLGGKPFGAVGIIDAMRLKDNLRDAETILRQQVGEAGLDPRAGTYLLPADLRPVTATSERIRFKDDGQLEEVATAQRT